MPVTPVFLLSLPRSGSTLVQRVLAAHDGVATAAEPWVLLPLLTPLQGDQARGDAWDRMVARAVEDFLAEVGDGGAAYRRGVGAVARDLYERAAPEGTRFFVDKTPPYHLIVDELVETFPDARVVFLWRNPLSVLASTVETLGKGRWNASSHRGDLFGGIENLVDGFERHRDRVYGVRYEDLLLDGETAWRDLSDFIGLDFDPAALERFSGVEMAGRMGDPTGRRAYQALSAEPLTKWRSTVSTPLRREWCRRWLRWIGHERLATMGYDLDELLRELGEVPMSSDRLADDIRDLGVAAVREALGARLPGARHPSSYRRLLGSSNGRR